MRSPPFDATITRNDPLEAEPTFSERLATAAARATHLLGIPSRLADASKLAIGQLTIRDIKTGIVLTGDDNAWLLGFRARTPFSTARLRRRIWGRRRVWIATPRRR